ncbi:MAG: VWA domain-containing protein [Planctomycetaceae bacterium]|nr:VWA domain-containing protein [Planctomycetaceae bacterium]
MSLDASTFRSFPTPTQEQAAASISSLIFHACLLGLFALILLPIRPTRNAGFATIVEQTEVDTHVTLDQMPVDQVLGSQQPRSGGAIAERIEMSISSDPMDATPRIAQAVPLAMSPTGVAAGILTEKVALRPSLASGGGGEGTAGTENTGIGASGKGAGCFFGINAEQESVVFVVDCSKSMNHPYPGEAKTRFGRVKVELVRTIGQMTEANKFFMVFFNTQALPMPSDRLVEATPGMQQFYLRWMAQFRAEGRTDPMDALLLALRLNPSVIYFLTDGDFDYRVVPAVTAANRRGTVIHTIGFGDDRGEKFLREIATRNRGTYKFIPETLEEPIPENQSGDAAYSLVAPLGSN